MMREILRPLINRIGTVVSTLLMTHMAVESDTANQIVTGLVAFLFVVLDLLMSSSARRLAEKQAQISIIDQFHDTER